MKKCKECGDRHSPLNRKKSKRTCLDDVQDNGFCTIKCYELHARKVESCANKIQSILQDNNVTLLIDLSDDGVGVESKCGLFDYYIDDSLSRIINKK